VIPTHTTTTTPHNRGVGYGVGGVRDDVTRWRVGSLCRPVGARAAAAHPRPRRTGRWRTFGNWHRDIRHSGRRHSGVGGQALTPAEVGIVYVDADCPEGEDYFRSTDSLRIASSSVSSRLQKAKRTR